MPSEGAKLAEVAPKGAKPQDKQGEVTPKDGKQQDESKEAAPKLVPVTDHEAAVLACLYNTPVGGAFFNQLEEGTGLNPRALTRAIKLLSERGYLEGISPAEGTTGKELAASEWEHAKSATDPEEKAMAETFAKMLEESTPRRRIYYPTEAGSLAFLANVLEYGVAMGWNTRVGKPYDSNAMYYRTPEGSRHFGLPMEE